MAGICLYSMIPLREEPSHRSQMVSQILFGESYSLLEETDEWFHVELNHDHYRGWMNRLQHTGNPFAGDLPYILNTQLFSMVNLDGISFPVGLGSYLPKEKWEIGDTIYSAVDPLPAEPVGDPHTKILHYAHWLQHAPYLWGGRTPLGIDCSGLVQLIFRLLGHSLRRDAWMQAEQGNVVELSQARSGDLAFFNNEQGKITHVGILLDNRRILHASGCVRIDHVDEHGIFRTDTKKHSHALHSVKRYLME